MTEVLRYTISISVVVFTVSSMLAVGLGYSARQILEPLRDWRAIVLAFVANFVLVPAFTIVLVRLVPLEPAVETGLLLLACAAGAPFLIKLTQAARGPLALSATLLVLLLPITVVYMPIVVPALVPEADVSSGPIARELLMTLLVPLGCGLLVNNRAPRVARNARPILGTLSTISLLVLVVAIVVQHRHAIVEMLASFAVVAALLFVLMAFGVGYLVARPGLGRRTVLALGTGQRNIAAATLVASQSVADPRALVMVTFTSVIEIVVLFSLAHWLRRRWR